MGGLRGVLQRIWNGAPSEARSVVTLPDGFTLDSLGLKGAAGVSVTPERAMTLGAVSACVRLIAESIASLPLHVYRMDGTRRQKVTGTPEYRLLHDEPNEIMTSFVLRETMAAHLLLWGNAYAMIVRNGGGEPVALLPIHPRVVTVRKQPNGQMAYSFTLNSGTSATKSYTLNQADVIHVPGLSFDGISGMSPIRYAAESIGLALAAEQFGASFFGNGSIPAGTITVPERLSPQQASDLRQSWQGTYGGPGNSNKTAVLFAGAKFERISMPPEEAQFIETRKYQVSDIARWYRVPPHMIGDLERATFSNIEHQALEFVQHTLRPWLVRFEQEINRKLFPSTSNGTPSGTYVEFNVDGLLRGDIKARGDYYIRGRQWGWLSANDIREKENMDPIEGGDVYLTPMNMTDAQSPGEEQPASEGASNV